MAHTIYRRPTANGGLFRQVVGLSLPADSDGSFSIPQAKLRDAGIDPPEVGDRISDADEVFWTVSSVGTLAGGNWPVTATEG